MDHEFFEPLCRSGQNGTRFFLGWQFLAAELVGGLLLIALSSFLIRLTYPQRWIEEARERLEEQSGDEADFDWRQRLASREGWYLVGHKFVMDWQMVWEEILIGFTIAGFVAVFVPPWLWEAIFLRGYEGILPGWLIMVENAMVAPFVAALTFIGSMGNIPLATVLNANGVLFAGIMGFIYSDLMVPPLVMINAKYYGWRMALYIAGVMFISIFVTAIALHTIFSLLSITPAIRQGNMRGRPFSDRLYLLSQHPPCPARRRALLAAPAAYAATAGGDGPRDGGGAAAETHGGLVLSPGAPCRAVPLVLRSRMSAGEGGTGPGVADTPSVV